LWAGIGQNVPQSVVHQGKSLCSPRKKSFFKNEFVYFGLYFLPWLAA